VAIPFIESGVAFLVAFAILGAASFALTPAHWRFSANDIPAMG
jgi:hypothetical protein